MTLWGSTHSFLCPTRLVRVFSCHSHLHIKSYFCYRSVGDADPLKVIKVAAKDGRTGEDMQLHYSNYKVAGNGSFGVVYQAKLLRTGEDVAIKKVLQDKRFKVRDSAPLLIWHGFYVWWLRVSFFFPLWFFFYSSAGEVHCMKLSGSLNISN